MMQICRFPTHSTNAMHKTFIYIALYVAAAFRKRLPGRYVIGHDEPDQKINKLPGSCHVAISQRKNAPLYSLHFFHHEFKFHKIFHGVHFHFAHPVGNVPH